MYREISDAKCRKTSGICLNCSFISFYLCICNIMDYRFEVEISVLYSKIVMYGVSYKEYKHNQSSYGKAHHFSTIGKNNVNSWQLRVLLLLNNSRMIKYLSKLDLLCDVFACLYALKPRVGRLTLFSTFVVPSAATTATAKFTGGDDSGACRASGSEFRFHARLQNSY